MLSKITLIRRITQGQADRMNITPWVIGALLLLAPIVQSYKLEVHRMEAPLALWTWVLPMILASCIASCYSAKHKLLAGLSYMILSALIFAIIHYINVAPGGVTHGNWSDPAKLSAAVTVFHSYLLTGSMPAIIGTALGFWFSKPKADVVDDLWPLSLFLLTIVCMPVFLHESWVRYFPDSDSRGFLQSRFIGIDPDELQFFTTGILLLIFAAIFFAYKQRLNISTVATMKIAKVLWLTTACVSVFGLIFGFLQPERLWFFAYSFLALILLSFPLSLAWFQVVLLSSDIFEKFESEYASLVWAFMGFIILGYLQCFKIFPVLYKWLKLKLAGDRQSGGIGLWVWPSTVLFLFLITLPVWSTVYLIINMLICLFPGIFLAGGLMILGYVKRDNMLVITGGTLMSILLLPAFQTGKNLLLRWQFLY